MIWNRDRGIIEGMRHEKGVDNDQCQSLDWKIDLSVILVAFFKLCTRLIHFLYLYVAFQVKFRKRIQNAAVVAFPGMDLPPSFFPNCP